MSKFAGEPAGALPIDMAGRTPLQGRSKASLERMLSAARDLMVERGSEDFTLQEISQRGQASIGSIYLRFESKDNLVRAVLAHALQTLSDSETAMIARLRRQCLSLADFVPRFVEDYAEVLRINAPLLRLAMARAGNDPLVAVLGKQAADTAVEQTNAALLQFSGEFAGDDHELRASSAYHIIFATLARQLSLGTISGSAKVYDWDLIKREFGRMCLAYLRDR
ncbi:TetR/AcrR family transcriptional regulator [Novosphingobium sp.]|uniref:TetR/AcrR family transcriptional regulator n=1 Tax=Novosphingobium sp. TaxID=1874826 RepID=UPI003D11942C